MPDRKPLLFILVLAALVGALAALLLRMALLDPGDARGHAGHGDHAQDPGEAPSPDAGPATRPATVLFRVGNEKCPIMGGDPDSGQLVVLEGIAIGICCAACEPEIRADPAGTLKKLMEQPESGPKLSRWLEDHPEVAGRVGLGTVKGAPAPPGPKTASRPAPGRRLTSLGNRRCPVDDASLDEAVIADVEGLRVALCTERCRSHFMANTPAFLERLGRDAGLRERIAAHRDLVARGGHGPHWHCAMCDVRSAAPGPCPVCGMSLVPAKSEPVFLLDNARCPIMGEPIGSEGTLVEFDGLGIRICCPSCEKTFRQYPEYYLAKLEREQGIRIPRIIKEGR